MRRFDRLRKLAREFVRLSGHELGMFKPASRPAPGIFTYVTPGTFTYVIGPGSFAATNNGTITLCGSTWTTSIGTTATTATLTSPTSTVVVPNQTTDKWFRSYCVHCGAECWLSETVNPHDHFDRAFTDKKVSDAMYVAQKLNKLAEQDGKKPPFPKRSRGIVIFGEKLGQPCPSSPRLLTCGDSTD